MITLSTSRDSADKPLKLIIGFNKAVDQYTRIIKVPSHLLKSVRKRHSLPVHRKNMSLNRHLKEEEL